MKTKIIQFIPAVIALLGSAFAPISYWCVYSVGYCYATWIHYIYQYFTNPLYNFALYFLPIALALMFIPRNIFNSWLKLAAWMIPLSFIFIATTDVNWTGIGMNFLPFYRDDAARLAAEIFGTVSLTLVIWKLFVARHSVK